MAAASWDALSDEEKQVYRDKAKNNSSECGSVDGRSNQSGSKKSSQLSAIQEKKEKQLNEKKRIDDRINTMLEMIPIDRKFASFPIYFMYGNYFYRNMDGDYSPAEIAIVKFTFKNGIEKRFHTFVNPGRPEMGYLANANDHTEATHRLPIPFIAASEIGEKDFHRIDYSIKKFLIEDGQCFDGGKPIVFTYTDRYSAENHQISVLKSFMTTFSHHNQLEIDIFPLERLFVILRSKLADMERIAPLPNEHFADIIMSRDPFDATIGISCEFHCEIDRPRYCALSYVTRWAFTMADNFCELLDVPLIAGRHLPENVTLTPVQSAFIPCSSKSTIDIQQNVQSSSMSTLNSALLSNKQKVQSASVSALHTNNDYSNV